MEGIDFGPNTFGLLVMLATGMFGIIKDSSKLFRLLCTGFVCLASMALGYSLFGGYAEYSILNGIALSW